jgi:phenylalanyl-tRNA synthetase alpha chain
MLAPGLYTVSEKLLRFSPLPLRVFEIGSCFRRESEGRVHLREFTMLNLVEWGTPLEERSQRQREFMELILDAANIQEYRLEVTYSEVYGESLDAVGRDGLELASSSMGPHPLDPAWRITTSWTGIGFGLERLLQERAHAAGIHRYSKSLVYLDGANLNIK